MQRQVSAASQPGNVEDGVRAPTRRIGILAKQDDR